MLSPTAATRVRNARQRVFRIAYDAPMRETTTKRLHRALALSPLIAGALLCAHAAPAVAYPNNGLLVVKEDLGVLPGDDYSVANAINSSRWITGASGLDAFVWTPEDGMVALEPEELMWGSDISDSGQIVGTASFLDYALDAFSWIPPGPAVYVEPPVGTLFDEFGNGVNELGTIVGSWEDPPHRPFIWTAPGPAVDLGTLRADDSGGGYASDVNELNAVVGGADADDGEEHAYYWTSDFGMLDLGVGDGVASHASAINDAGEIVGNYNNGIFTFAVYWSSPLAALQSLGTIAGLYSRAYDINGDGVVVGESSVGFFEVPVNHGFRVVPGGLMLDLGTLGGDNSSARGINDAGHIVGSAERLDGNTHAIAWWVYKINGALSFPSNKLVAPVPDPDWGGKSAIAVALYSTRRADARNVALTTLTLETAEGVSFRPATSRDGTPIVEYRDVDSNRLEDLVVWFDVSDAELSEDEALLVQGATRDRKNGILADVPESAALR